MPLILRVEGGEIFMVFVSARAECPLCGRSLQFYSHATCCNLQLTLISAWIPSSRSFSFSYTLSEVPKTRLFVNILLRYCTGVSQD